MPGVPTPMPRIGLVASATDVVDEVVDDVERRVAVAAVEVAASRCAPDLAAQVDEGRR